MSGTPTYFGPPNNGILPMSGLSDTNLLTFPNASTVVSGVFKGQLLGAVGANGTKINEIRASILTGSSSPSTAPNVTVAGELYVILNESGGTTFALYDRIPIPAGLANWIGSIRFDGESGTECTGEGLYVHHRPPLVLEGTVGGAQQTLLLSQGPTAQWIYAHCLAGDAS